jgi:hypothetical protein
MNDQIYLKKSITTTIFKIEEVCRNSFGMNRVFDSLLVELIWAQFYNLVCAGINLRWANLEVEQSRNISPIEGSIPVPLLRPPGGPSPNPRQHTSHRIGSLDAGSQRFWPRFYKRHVGISFSLPGFVRSRLLFPALRRTCDTARIHLGLYTLNSVPCPQLQLRWIT